MATFAGTTQKCNSCEKTVYFVELITDNKVYHKAYFRCHHCKGTLKMALFRSFDEKCVACMKTVYPLERVAVDGTSYHKACFRCVHGGCVISPSNYVAHEHRLYYRHHHNQLFKEKGNFSQLDKHEHVAPVDETAAAE
ncbi:GATA TYPE ZINC FINGER TRANSCRIPTION FACTOR FAMILY PROTEIN [Salix koriyanagi]|uniref:GATA TYPE ZINC FINGER TRANSCRIPTION FACTOR FAMILY PROTEIN n=1 Tax=Salix koriyanagi TaxID=2511006 RepID=A0A9Q0WDV9_9ROSI|nr:GATA TYPE ZINC FINGER TRANSCRIPTION FACTOR FAMILY PROTEIN [Salix koriyanagi]